MNSLVFNATLAGLSRTAVEAVWRASWQGAAAVLLVWVICRGLPRLPASVRCWLWRAVLVKFVLGLVLPVSVAVPVVVRAAAPAAEPTRAAVGARPDVSARLLAPVYGREASRPSVASTPSNEFEATRPQIRRRGLLRQKPTTVSENHALLHANSRVAPIEANVIWPPLLFSALFAVYLIGVATCIVRLVVVGLRTRRFLSGACQPLCDSETIADAGALALRFGVHELPALLTSTELRSSLLVSAPRPAILLPEGDELEFGREARRLMIAHELAHLRRHDLAWSWLAAAAHALFSFHPLVWLARREEELAREMDCDALAIAATHVSSARYGALIAAVVSYPVAGLRPCALAALGISNDVSNVCRRLLALRRLGSQMPVSRLRLLVAAVGVATAGALVPWRVVAAAGDALSVSPSAAKQVVGHDKPFPTLLDLPPGDGVIEGRVTIAPAQTPGRACILMLSSGETPPRAYRFRTQITTDIDGNYRIEHVPAGTYHLRLFPLDAEALNFQTREDRTPITLNPGQHVARRDFTFVQKTVTVFGKIADARTGQPVTNVRISGCSQASGEASIILSGAVDRDGSYEVRVPAGSSEVIVKNADLDYPPAPSDSPYRMAQSSGMVRKLIDARLGQSLNLNFSVPTETAKAPAHSLPPITGTVIGANGKPVAGADVNFFCASKVGQMYDWTLVRTDANGQFRWEGLWPRWIGTEFDVRARDSNVAGLVSQPVHFKLTAGGLTAPLTLRLVPNLGAAVEGRVVDANGHAIASAPVYLDAEAGVAKLHATTLTDSEGRYRFTRIWPDIVVRLSATKDGYGAGATPTDGGVTLKAGERHSMPPLVIERAYRSIAGTIMTSSGVPAAGQFINVGANRGFSARTMTDSRGRFRVDNVPGGRLLLYYSGDVTPMPVRAGDMRVKIVYDWKPWKAKG